MNKINKLEKAIKDNSSQLILDYLYEHPVIHFSKDARSIFMDGFKYGAKNKDIDITFDTSKVDNEGSIIRTKESQGINYAFDSLSFSFENNCNDYEYGLDNGLGMYEETAILCLTDLIKTKHSENFEQCLFYGEDIDLKSMVLLKCEGDAIDEDGETYYNENGEEYEKWTAYSKIEGHLVRSNENLSLSECIEKSVRVMILKQRYPSNIIDNFNAMYAETEYNEIKSPNKEKKLTLLEAKEIAYKVRREMNDEYDLNNDFVDYCDLCAEEVEKNLLERGYDCEIKNNFYIHRFEDSELDAYEHFWVECDDIIIDPSRSQFDNNQYAQLKKLSKNHKETNEIQIKKIKNSKELKL